MVQGKKAAAKKAKPPVPAVSKSHKRDVLDTSLIVEGRRSRTPSQRVKMSMDEVPKLQNLIPVVEETANQLEEASVGVCDQQEASNSKDDYQPDLHTASDNASSKGMVGPMLVLDEDEDDLTSRDPTPDPAPAPKPAKGKGKAKKGVKGIELPECEFSSFSSTL